MFTSPPPHRRQTAAAALLTLCAGLTTGTAQSTWNSTTGNWNDGTKWSPSGAPVSGASTVLQFNQAAANYIATNDIAGDFTLNRLIFSGSTAGGTTTLARNGTQSLVFAANGEILPEIQLNATGNSRTISMPMVLNADTTVTSSITDSVNNLTFNGPLSGAGNLIINYSSGGSAVVLSGSSTIASTHAGTHLMNGWLVVAATANNPLGSGPLTISGGRLYTNSGTANYANTLNIAGNTTLLRSTVGQSMSFTGGGTIQGTNVSHTLTLDRSANSFTLGGAFTGSGNGLTLAGAGTLALGSGAADTAANTFDGTTTVTAATLSLNKANGTNAVAGNLAVSGGTLSWARSNQIADTSSLTQTGGTVRLEAGLSETVQATTLSDGAFSLGGGSSYNTDSLVITASAGARRFGGTLTIGSGGLTINHDGVVGSNRNAFTSYDTPSTSTGTVILNGDLTFNNATAADTKVQLTRGAGTGNIDLGGGIRTFTINDGPAAEDLEIALGIQNGGLTKEGAGVLSILNVQSTYVGDTTINAGTIRVSNAAGQRLANQSTYALADVAGVTLDITNSNQTVGGLSGGGATGGSVLLGTGTLTVGNNNASTTYAGEISGAGGVTKTGTGTLTLSSNLGYTGATLVSDGTLVVDGELASSGVTLNGATAILAGSGRVNGLTLTQGTFAPGNSPGVFTVDGNVSFGAGSVFSIEIGSVSSFDQLVVNGGASTVNIEAGASLSLPGFELLAAFDEGTEFIFIDNRSVNPITGAFLGYDEGQSFVVGANTFVASYQLGAGGNDFGFTVTAIPEPSAFAVLAGFASLAFAAQRRRR